MKFPSLQFYPGDWLRDSVSGCSLAAQGLWLRMLFLMHDSERYGYLCQNGQPIPPEQIARRCGCTPDEYAALLAELESAGVPSRTSNGTIYSRRMMRDAEERAKVAARKRKQRGHADVTPSVTPPVTPESRNGHPPSSYSSSSSVTGRPVTCPPAREGPSPPGECAAVRVYREESGAVPSIHDAGRIEREVKDLDVWRRVIRRLISNKVPPTKVGTMLDVYADEMKKNAGNGVAEVRLV